MIESLIAIIFELLWVLLLFYFGRKKSSWFYFALYIPLIVPAMIMSVIFPEPLNTLTTLTSIFSVWIIVFVILIIAERIVWGITLKEIAENDELVWFYIAYFVPFIGWFLYRFTKVR